MPGDIIADNHITTSASGTLDIGGKGTVQVTLGGGVINHVPASLSKKSLMEQDDATTLVQLAGADGVVKGTGGQLSLVDEDGNVISDVQHPGYRSGRQHRREGDLGLPDGKQFRRYHQRRAVYRLRS